MPSATEDGEEEHGRALVSESQLKSKEGAPVTVQDCQHTDGSAPSPSGGCCRSRPLPAFSPDRKERVRETLKQFEREVQQGRINPRRHSYGDGLPIVKLLSRVPHPRQQGPSSTARPNAAATSANDSQHNDQTSSDNMSIESESDEKGEDFGSDDSERCVGLEDGHIENGERWEMTSMKSQSSPQAGHRTEGGSSDDFDQGQLREPANLVGDPRRGSVQGWLEADSVKRRVDTDQAGGIPFADESRWKKPSTVSRKRPRRAAAPAQEQATSMGGGVDAEMGTTEDGAKRDGSDGEGSLRSEYLGSDEACSSGQKQAATTNAEPTRSTSKRRGRPSKAIDDSDDEYGDPGTSKGDVAVEDGPSPKRRPRSTRAASLRSSTPVQAPPPPTTMEQPLVIDSDDESNAENGANAKQGVGAAGTSGESVLPSVPSNGDGDRIESSLVATDFGDGIMGVRSRKERIDAMPGIHKVQFTWGYAFLNQQSIRAVPHETRLFFPNKDAQGAVEVTRLDLIRLQETVFLNDTLIDFYLRYLLSKPDSFGEGLTASQVHVFSPLFVQAITNAANSCRADAYVRIVKKWTKGLDLFSKKFVLFPINSWQRWYTWCISSPKFRPFLGKTPPPDRRNVCLHWSLVILCNPNNFVATKKPQLPNPPQEPSPPPQQQQQQQSPRTDVGDAPSTGAVVPREMASSMTDFADEKRPLHFMSQACQVDKQVVSRAGGEHSASNGSVTPPPPTEPAPAAHISISAPRASETCSSHGDGGWPASPALARYNQRVEEGEDRDSSGGETELEGPAEFAVGSDGHIPNGHCAGDLDSDRGEQADTMDQDEGQPMCTGDLVGGGKPGRGGGDGGGVGDQTSGVVDDVAVEDLIVTLSPQKAGEIEEHSTLDENEASRDLSYEDTSNGQPDDSWSHVRSRRRPEEDLRASGAASRAIEQLPYQVPSAAAEVTNRAGRKMRNCRQGEQAVDVPRCSLQDIPASHAGPTKRPVRNVVGVNLGGGDSSGAGMVDLTEVGEDETPIETVRVGPVSSRTRRCPQDSSPSLASEGPAALSGETPVNLSSSGQPPARATVDSANRGAQRCVSRSEERSGGQYLEDSPSCGNDDELDTGTGDGEEIRDDIRADIRAGCAAGEASRSSLMHGTETPTAMQERRSSLGSVSNLTDKGNDELACEQVDAMDISMNVPTDDAVPGTLESSVVDGDAGGSGLCTETQVAEGVASGPSTGNGEGGGFEKERWVEVREPVVANRRKSRRVSDRARVDAGMDAEMDAMNKEQIPCMFMLDSTRGHRSQEVFKIVRKYVEAAWNDSRRDTLGQADVRPLTLPGCSPQVPQQSNDCDCGVYVIHYAKLFLKSAPTINRGVFHNSGRGVFSKKWFKESCIRQERRNIRNTVEALRWEALQQQRNGSSPC